MGKGRDLISVRRNSSGNWRDQYNESLSALKRTDCSVSSTQSLLLSLRLPRIGSDYRGAEHRTLRSFAFESDSCLNLMGLALVIKRSCDKTRQGRLSLTFNLWRASGIYTWAYFTFLMLPLVPFIHLEFYSRCFKSMSRKHNLLGFIIPDGKKMTVRKKSLNLLFSCGRSFL